METYIVKEGDNIATIAKKYNISIVDLINQNNLENVYYLEPGLELIIPEERAPLGFTYYTVKKGDSLYEIAKHYNISVKDLSELNGLEINEYIYPEQRILVPEEGVEVYITKEKDQDETYQVKKGDTISGIANENGMTVKEFMKLNTQIKDTDSIMPGDEVVISVPTPELSVIVQKEELTKKKYYADTVYVKDSSMYEGESKVVQKGKAGVKQVTSLVSYKNGQAYRSKVTDTEVIKKAVPKKVVQGTKVRPTYIKPINGGTLTSRVGARWGRMHEGVDWACPIGTTVMASREGTVIQAGWINGYGNCVTISHGDGVITRYGHMNSVSVSVGQSVSQGETIGYSGNTGRSTGPHLHFELRINGVVKDPLDYL